MIAFEQSGPPCIVDLAPRWTMDATLFLILSAFLLVWSIAVGSTSTSVIGFVVAAASGLLADRLAAALTDPAKIADQSLEQPVGAYQQSMARYLVVAMLTTAALVAVALALALALKTSSEGVAPLAGVCSAIGITRLIGVRRLRRLERARRIRLSARAGGVWRRSRRYYARPDPGIGGR